MQYFQLCAHVFLSDAPKLVLRLHKQQHNVCTVTISTQSRLNTILALHLQSNSVGEYICTVFPKSVLVLY